MRGLSPPSHAEIADRLSASIYYSLLSQRELFSFEKALSARSASFLVPCGRVPSSCTEVSKLPANSSPVASISLTFIDGAIKSFSSFRCFYLFTITFFPLWIYSPLAVGFSLTFTPSRVYHAPWSSLSAAMSSMPVAPPRDTLLKFPTLKQ